MTRVLRFVWGAGSPGEANWTRLLELACAATVCVNLAAASMRPDPVDATFVCSVRAVRCQELAHENALLLEEMRP